MFCKGECVLKTPIAPIKNNRENNENKSLGIVTNNTDASLLLTVDGISEEVFTSPRLSSVLLYYFLNFNFCLILSVFWVYALYSCSCFQHNNALICSCVCVWFIKHHFCLFVCLVGSLQMYEGGGGWSVRRVHENWVSIYELQFNINYDYLFNIWIVFCCFFSP